ncbi:hypothetical protein H5410_051965 [Solanum commersonii]|uniref:Uncharacterized protein n=1 Tax=Solanum commersonii TaxID=4109 RepID=A0A9J5X016_SOLCO|nr:hypothetical protein H5410_051965 [Solanum commersonii]
MEKESGIINNVNNKILRFQPKLQSSFELVDKVLARNLILGGKGFESMILDSDGFESKLLSSFEFVDKVLVPTLILVEKGSEPMPKGFVELVDKVLAPTLNLEGKEFDSKLLGYVELIHKALAPPRIICSKKKNPLDIVQIYRPPSNAKIGVKDFLMFHLIQFLISIESRGFRMLI